VGEIGQRAIRTAFLEPESEVLVTVSTVESLLGDKLTAFAPTTTEDGTGLKMITILRVNR
jgi:hypothetical protein